MPTTKAVPSIGGQPLLHSAKTAKPWFEILRSAILAPLKGRPSEGESWRSPSSGSGGRKPEALEAGSWGGNERLIPGEGPGGGNHLRVRKATARCAWRQVVCHTEGRRVDRRETGGRRPISKDLDSGFCSTGRPSWNKTCLVESLSLCKSISLQFRFRVASLVGMK